MSKISASIITLVLGFSLAVSAAQADLLAEKVTSGGFVRQPDYGIRIFRTGLIESFKGQDVKTMGYIYLTTRDELVSTIEKPVSKMVDGDSGTPTCADVPQIIYNAYRITGEKVTFAQRLNCHTWASPELLQIKNILDGFSGIEGKFLSESL